ncbi:MAG: prepilin-type N-terminal cleavage/methylation domain-containing protein [Phycisphaerae bacterium]|nr:prepilin-type N-terminal cleavage/methylation domain-containing protein [Phycisphaerae bacterium]
MTSHRPNPTLQPPAQGAPPFAHGPSRAQTPAPPVSLFPLPSSNFSGPKARAFSLAEMMVAIGILGIGLTMVACFFPVAMYQHADTMSQQRAMEIARAAKDLVLSKPQPTLVAGTDPNLWRLTEEYKDFTVRWDEQVVPSADPYNDPEFQNQPRYVWHLLSRNVGATRQHMIAVCRVLPGQQFITTAYTIEQVPWPIGSQADIGAPLNYDGPQRLKIQLLQGMAPFNSGGLPLLIPPGSKLISKRTGLVYTVLSLDMASSPNAINLREQIDLKDWDPANPHVLPYIPFIIFPPPINGSAAAVDSPVNWNTAQFGDQSPLIMVLTF